MNGPVWRLLGALFVGLAVAAMGNGLIAWRSIGIVENDLAHLAADVAEIKADVRRLAGHLLAAPRAD